MIYSYCGEIKSNGFFGTVSTIVDTMSTYVEHGHIYLNRDNINFYIDI